jgi:Rieske Fe-S protein
MEPADCIGFIGRNSGDEHCYIATGDSGQGITNGVIASLVISELILDGNSPWAKAYDPARMIAKNVGEYLSENLTALRSFAEYLTMGDIANIERLKPGEGALLRSGLKKIAVCRDQQGRLHTHSAACTHMGCVVHWNSLEQCWDCPCHGSQFAPDGTALNGPAVAPLPTSAPSVASKLRNERGAAQQGGRDGAHSFAQSSKQSVVTKPRRAAIADA